MVTAQGVSVAERLRESAEAVTVIETERAERESADLGEVLRRTQGVGVQRSGGLGSNTRFSLNGMTADQIRFFVDGVPLELTGFLNLSVVPVNLLERVEIYRGVVPVRFGIDALGGAVNLVTDSDYKRSRAAASLQAGSFGTTRITAQARHRFAGTPLVASGSVFFDHADNDYPVDVEVPNDRGEPARARVYRFHDAYRAFGANLEGGVVDSPWARRLLLRLFATDSFKDEQHNQIMTVPYGEVQSGERAQGASLRYEQPLRFVDGLSLQLLAAYTRRSIDFIDDGRYIYDWYGRRIRERARPGEIETPEDTTYVEHRGLGRVGLSYRITPEQQLRWVSTLNLVGRAGENRLYESDRFLDPASALQQLSTAVNGLEYELDALSGALENVLFAKHYHYALAAEQGSEFGQAPIDEGFEAFRNSAGRFGGGNALRVRLTDWLNAKASYEYAARLPRADEVFGDGRLILANFKLEPEASHNANLGLAVADVWLGEHVLRGELNGFARYTDNLIQAIPLGIERVRYHNVWSSRALGVEAAAGWTSPGRYVWLDANFTWLDLRNTSTKGSFADFRGDRVPNRPWLYANASARLQWSGMVAPNDEISLTFYTTYVESFFRSWESAGRPDYKIVIDSQLLHNIVLGYVMRGTRVFSTSIELQNLTDQRAYDFFGVQKPGRALYFKATIEL